MLNIDKNKSMKFEKHGRRIDNIPWIKI